MRFTELLAAFLFLSGFGAFAAEPLPVPKGLVLLKISGNIEQTNAPGEAQFDRDMLEALGPASIEVTSPWSDRKQVFEGVSMQAVLNRVGARGKTIKASALNDYTISIPFSDLKYNPILAMRVDGTVLTMRDKGPLWVVYPRDTYKELQDAKIASRWVWLLNRLAIE
jgi:hypothetical protein